MDQYLPERVHTRVEYVHQTYMCRDTYKVFENFTYPISVYDESGKITEANDIFRKLAGVNEDEIHSGKVNLFDLLNGNTKLADAAHQAFDGKEEVCQNMCPILHTKDVIADYQITLFPNAIFFPMTCDHEHVLLAGMLLDENKKDDTEDHPYATDPSP